MTGNRRANPEVVYATGGVVTVTARNAQTGFEIDDAYARRGGAFEVPIALFALLPARAPGAVAAGRRHTCFVVPGRLGVRCFGANDRGQLGDGTLANQSSAVDVLPFP